MWKLHSSLAWRMARDFSSRSGCRRVKGPQATGGDPSRPPRPFLPPLLSHSELESLTAQVGDLATRWTSGLEQVPSALVPQFLHLCKEPSSTLL